MSCFVVTLYSLLLEFFGMGRPIHCRLFLVEGGPCLSPIDVQVAVVQSTRPMSKPLWLLLPISAALERQAD